MTNAHPLASRSPFVVATEAGASLPVHAPSSLSNAEAREFYLEGERGIAALADDLAARGVPARERGLELFNTRNALRAQTRVAMADRDLAAILNATDPNLSLSELVSRAYAKSYTGDALRNHLAESASKSRTSLNDAFGLSP